MDRLYRDTPPLARDTGGLTVVNIWRTIRIAREDVADVQSEFRHLKIVRAGGLRPVNVWAVQTAPLARYVRRAGFSDHVAHILNDALRTDSLTVLEKVATPEPPDTRLVLGLTTCVMAASLAIRVVAGA